MSTSAGSSSATALIAHHDVAFAQSLAEPCERDGITATHVASVADALRVLAAAPPDVALIQASLDHGGGLQLAARIKREGAFTQVVAIFGSEETAPLGHVRWDDAPFDDYIVGPVSPRDLVARLRLNICRSRRSLDASPLTRLPGNSALTRELERRMASGEDFAVCHVDLDSFKAFNDRYGFARGDEALRLTAQLCRGVVDDLAPSAGFVGHLGGDDFVMIVPGPRAADAAYELTTRFDRAVPGLYDEADRVRGFLVAPNRRGAMEEFPLMTVSVAVIANTRGRLTHIGQISAILAELKQQAKAKSGGSKVVFDRRGTAPD